jgi:chromosome segregation ATPase
LAIERHNSPAVQEQIDLAMTLLDRHVNELETVIQKWTDRVSAVHFRMGKVSKSIKLKEQQAKQINLTLGQQNKHIRKLSAVIVQARSHDPFGFGQMGGDSIAPWRIAFSQKP